MRHLALFLALICFFSFSKSFAEMIRGEVKKTNNFKNTVIIKTLEKSELREGDRVEIGFNCELSIQKIKGSSLQLSTKACENKGPLTEGNRVTLEFHAPEDDLTRMGNRKGWRIGGGLGFTQWTISNAALTLSSGPRTSMHITLETVELNVSKRGWLAGGSLALVSGTTYMAGFFHGAYSWALGDKKYYYGGASLQLYLTEPMTREGIGLGGIGGFGYFLDRKMTVEGVARLTFVGLNFDIMETVLLGQVSYFF